MSKIETQFSSLEELYKSEWTVNDFLIVENHYPLIEDNLPRRGDTYLMGICVSGSLTINVNAVTYHCSKDYMLIGQPFRLFQMCEASDDCRVSFIVFSKRFLIADNINLNVMDRFQFSHVDAIPVIHVGADEAKYMNAQFKLIGEKFKEVTHPFRKEILGNLLLILLHEFEVGYRKHFHVLETVNTRGKELVNLFTNLIQVHFRKEHSVKFYARTLHVTSKHLTATIKDATGRTASAFILEALSIEAQVLITLDNISIKEASNLLHFPNQSMFGKFFKRSVGVSPLEFKKHL